ncbi:MAG: GtrA family protein [Thermodesulforhabdaceae bacterium]|jgi:putative flippase GtrA
MGPRSFTTIRYLFGYIGIGVLNTIVGHGTIFGLMFLGLNPYISNILGYIVGISFSYLLNKSWNFRSKKPHREAYPRFVLSLMIAYIVNVAILFIGLDIVGLNKYIAQIVAGGFYAAIGFLASRYIVFSEVR